MSIKGMNIKAFLANHIEKVALGTIALMLLGIWAKEFFAGNWSREKRVPAEMLTKIDEKRKEIDSSVWPEPMAQPFALVDFQSVRRRCSAPLTSRAMTSRPSCSCRCISPRKRRVSPA